MSLLRSIAIHLPQFHPIPENDEWWGKGFTEWTNVTKAKPLFENHYQPHLPADLGYYDLRLEEARIAQANLAKEYGIYGFCYYHYWFNGKRLLEKPVQAILESRKPDFPFMLCWANENWSRRWDGSEHVLLIKQEYSIEDAALHCKHLIPYFKDERYIKIDGKPVFAFYRPKLIVELKDYIDSFRKTAQEEGISLYLTWFDNAESFGDKNTMSLFDAAVEQQPQSEYLYRFMGMQLEKKLFSKPHKKLYNKILKAINQSAKVDESIHEITHYLDYNEYVDFLTSNYEYPVAYKRFPGVNPMWDNTARRGKSSFLFKNSTPEKYSEWLQYHIDNFKPYSNEENFIFINAWNEWAEGNHLEPCKKWGRKFLEATNKVLQIK